MQLGHLGPSKRALSLVDALRRRSCQYALFKVLAETNRAALETSGSGWSRLKERVKIQTPKSRQHMNHTSFESPKINAQTPL